MRQNDIDSAEMYRCPECGFVWVALNQALSDQPCPDCDTDMKAASPK